MESLFIGDEVLVSTDKHRRSIELPLRDALLHCTSWDMMPHLLKKRPTNSSGGEGAGSNFDGSTLPEWLRGPTLEDELDPARRVDHKVPYYGSGQPIGSTSTPPLQPEKTVIQNETPKKR